MAYDKHKKLTFCTALAVNLKRIVRHEKPDRPIENNAICGNCGKEFKEHHFEEGTIYCNIFTTGDIFTDTPSSQILIDFIEENYPKHFERYIRKWKKLTHNA